jgi:hypothetical protein
MQYSDSIKRRKGKMGKMYTVYVKKDETIDQAEDRFFSENPELIENVDLTLFLVDLHNDFVED